MMIVVYILAGIGAVTVGAVLATIGWACTDGTPVHDDGCPCTECLEVA